MKKLSAESWNKNGLDFSDVDSREKAEVLVEEGKLFRLFLLPMAFGGKDIPPNIVHVPAGIPEIQAQITGTIMRFAQKGLIDNLKVTPEYKGSSVIPAKIKIFTSHSGKAGEFNPTIEIW
jgi:hypothetical protein